jgi:hypothetical protein
VENSYEIGEKQMTSFENSWPKGFHEPIKKRIITLTVAKKHMQVDDKIIVNTEIIYARAMALQNSSREYDTENLLTYELSPYPLSMFDNDGEMKIAIPFAPKCILLPIDRLYNSACRSISGCLSSTPLNHLYLEANFCPIQSSFALSFALNLSQSEESSPLLYLYLSLPHLPLLQERPSSCQAGGFSFLPPFSPPI